MVAGGNRWWGFHQLSDQWATRLVEHAGVGAGDLVLDIGAGTGTITAPLLGIGARVVAIELHPARLAALRERFDVDSVRIVRADATDLRLPRRPFHVVANPPWATTTAVLRRLVHPGSRLLRADLVVPRHVADRWVSGRAPGARRWQSTYTATPTGIVPRSAFRPNAPAAAVILTVSRRERDQRPR